MNTKKKEKFETAMNIGKYDRENNLTERRSKIVNGKNNQRKLKIKLNERKRLAK